MVCHPYRSAMDAQSVFLPHVSQNLVASQAWPLSSGSGLSSIDALRIALAMALVNTSEEPKLVDVKIWRTGWWVGVEGCARASDR